MKSPRLLLFGPLAVIQAYLLITVLLFSGSAWSYPVHRPVLFYGYLVAVQLALFLGYRWTVSRPALGYRGWPSITTLARAAIGINLILLVPTALFRTGGALDLVAALTDPGAAYTQSLDARAGMNPVIEYIRITTGPLLACLYPITVLYWSRLSPLARALAVLALLGTVLTFIAMGTNKAIADTAVLFPWLLAAAHFSRQLTLTRRSALSIATVALLGLVGATAFFGRTMAMRTGSVAAFGYFGLAGLRANDQALHVRHLPSDVRIAVVGLDFYLTHGYYALSMSLEEPFVPCWGVGNSYFLVRNAARILRDESIASCPYPVRSEVRMGCGEGLVLHLPLARQRFYLPGISLGDLLRRRWLWCGVARHAEGRQPLRCGTLRAVGDHAPVLPREQPAAPVRRGVDGILRYPGRMVCNPHA